MPKRLIWIVSILTFATLACRAATDLRPAEEPTVTANPSPTIVPLPTVTPAPNTEPVATPTQALEPSPDPQAEATPTQVIPGDLEAALTEMPFTVMGTPFTGDSYKSVPILPGAYNAAETGDALTYYIALPPEEVLAYYQDALEVDGWQFFGGETGNAEGKVIIFSKGDKLATIAILPNPTGGEDTMVILAVP
jgi:hypothetical protein